MSVQPLRPVAMPEKMLGRLRRYASVWARTQSSGASSAFVPLSFAPGEAYQFDWSHDVVLIDGATTTIKVAHVRLTQTAEPERFSRLQTGGAIR